MFCALAVYTRIWTLGVVFRTFDYYIWTLGVVFCTLYYIWTLAVVFRTFDCIMFGHKRESCFILSTVLYLDIEAVVFCVLLE